MKLKVCGMKYQDNIQQVAGLQPDYLGFIFYKNSLRNFHNTIPNISKDIKKVGVFVNSDLQYVLKAIKNYKLDAVQLHGQESPDFCHHLKEKAATDKSLEIIKVFSIMDTFNFDVLMAYEDVVDYFLFDSKGKLPGGNGYTFNWGVLKEYPSTKPFFLSGGIGLQEIENLKAFEKNSVSKYCYALDVNSKFEDEPGLKNIEQLKEFKKQLSF